MSSRNYKKNWQWFFSIMRIPLLIKKIMRIPLIKQNKLLKIKEETKTKKKYIKIRGGQIEKKN
jgi:hypothetical protein